MNRFLAEVLEGLSQTPRTLPCKYFYDERGAELFERICELDEYYLTRADLEATREHIHRIAERVGSGARLVELGSGAGIKTRILLEHLDVASYVPVDISAEQLARTADALAASFPDLDVRPVAADYTQSVELPNSNAARTVVYFPGSTIGNFHPPEVVAFLRRMRALVAPDGGALIGVDLKKDRATLERAYDDRAGVTALFNKNLLERINTELGGDFELDRWEHRAFYDENRGRIEMHLVSTIAQRITVGGQSFDFAAGEFIRSEVSYKYSLADFARLATEAMLTVEDVWLDPRQRFSLQWVVPRGFG
ncbi:MAG TPA: L-histidine N(alpha)-methyltransferase [Polyangiaceae bacterium]|nr:L-histidine N(alpha)-methyltransferase [Polyangiaceae bacterium]